MFWTAIANLIAFMFFAQTHATIVNFDSQIISVQTHIAPIDVSAERGAVLDNSDRVFLFSKQADDPQAIASITKLMTALVFLDNNPGWEETYEITREDIISGGRLHLFLGEKVKVKELFNTALVASDNGAAMALVHASGLSEEAFIQEMNDRARALGLSQTHFVDPIGLSDHNVSTAREVAWLARTALEQPDIKEAVMKKEYRFTTLNGTEKLAESTDYLLFDSAISPLKVLGGKTGYTDQAGYCFVGLFQTNTGQEFISVVLNSDGRNQRFQESKKLINWALDSYNWKD